MDHYTELSRLVNLDKLHKRRLGYSLQANPKECLALSQRFGIVAIHSLKAEYTLESGRTPYQGYYLTMNLSAEVVQSCVVSLKDVPQRIEEKVNLHVLDQKYQQVTLDDIYQEDDIEYSHEDTVDFGEIAAQHLSLLLDPYPRAVQELPSDKTFPDKEQPKKVSPFSVLKTLTK